MDLASRHCRRMYPVCEECVAMSRWMNRVSYFAFYIRTTARCYSSHNVWLHKHTLRPPSEEYSVHIQFHGIIGKVTAARSRASQGNWKATQIEKPEAGVNERLLPHSFALGEQSQCLQVLAAEDILAAASRIHLLRAAPSTRQQLCNPHALSRPPARHAALFCALQPRRTRRPTH